MSNVMLDPKVAIAIAKDMEMIKKKAELLSASLIENNLLEDLLEDIDKIKKVLEKLDSFSETTKQLTRENVDLLTTTKNICENVETIKNNITFLNETPQKMEKTGEYLNTKVIEIMANVEKTITDNCNKNYEIIFDNIKFNKEEIKKVLEENKEKEIKETFELINRLKQERINFEIKIQKSYEENERLLLINNELIERNGIYRHSGTLENFFFFKEIIKYFIIIYFIIYVFKNDYLKTVNYDFSLFFWLGVVYFVLTFIGWLYEGNEKAWFYNEVDKIKEAHDEKKKEKE